MKARKLNERTSFSLIPTFSVVIHQGNQTVVLTNQEVSHLYREASLAEPEEDEKDLTERGFQV